MPELPEAETIVRQLQRQIAGRKIVAAEVNVRKLVRGKIPLSVIRSVRRRAKAIVLELGSGQSLLIRLGMTGHFHYGKKGKGSERKGSGDDKENKYVVVIFHLHDGSVLTFNDVRKFGSVQVLSAAQLENVLKRMGPEPLSKEFTLDAFSKLLSRKKNANLKTALMDQNFIAGIGNIYAQEMLYHARINPQRKIGTLADAEVRALYKSMRKTLELAIRHHGTTVQDYVHIEGSGGFQRFLAVYERKKCPQGHSIQKIYLGGRGTYWCGKCQR